MEKSPVPPSFRDFFTSEKLALKKLALKKLTLSQVMSYFLPQTDMTASATSPESECILAGLWGCILRLQNAKQQPCLHIFRGLFHGGVIVKSVSESIEDRVWCSLSEQEAVYRQLSCLLREYGHNRRLQRQKHLLTAHLLVFNRRSGFRRNRWTTSEWFHPIWLLLLCCRAPSGESVNYCFLPGPCRHL